MFGSNEDGGQGSGQTQYVTDAQTMNALGFGSPGAGQTPMGNMHFAAQNYGDLGDMGYGGAYGGGNRAAQVALSKPMTTAQKPPTVTQSGITFGKQVATGTYQPRTPMQIIQPAPPAQAPGGYVPPYQAIQPAFWWTTDPAQMAAAAGDPEAQAKMAQAQQGGGITWTKILIGLTLVAGAAGGYYYWKKSKSSGGKKKRESAPEED